MASQRSIYNFVAKPNANLMCSICLDVSVEPKQSENCGKLFCSKCIDLNGHNPCPTCRRNAQFFLDVKSGREIKELKVKCDNADRCYEWTGTIGTLDNHMSTCQFALVPCPNKCEEDGQLTIMRKDLYNHLKTTCPNRAHQCQHCGVKRTYASITEVHDKVCNKKRVHCPNKERGCPLSMERGKTKQHVRSVCGYTEVACTYESLGCGVRMLRKDIKEHEKHDREEHLTFALVTVTKQSEQIKELAEQNMIMSEQSKKLSEKIKAFVFKVPGYASKKEKNDEIESTPFYTHPGGYKLSISVFINGDGDGKGTHVSVFTDILEGRYDDQLYWPFMGTVKFELLNQLTNDKHYSRSITFDDSDDMLVGSSMGYSKFVPHSSLSHDPATNIQYLLDDTLYFLNLLKVSQTPLFTSATHS